MENGKLKVKERRTKFKPNSKNFSLSTPNFQFVTFRTAEGYIDTCIGVVVLMMLVVIAMNLFSFVALRVELDRIADELIETASYSGSFGDEFEARSTDMMDDYFQYDVSYGADSFYNQTKKQVQLGDVMWVKLSVNTNVQGLGIFKIPVTVSVKRSGISERYWKG